MNSDTVGCFGTACARGVCGMPSVITSRRRWPPRRRRWQGWPQVLPESLRSTSAVVIPASVSRPASDGATCLVPKSTASKSPVWSVLPFWGLAQYWPVQGIFSQPRRRDFVDDLLCQSPAPVSVAITVSLSAVVTSVVFVDVARGAVRQPSVPTDADGPVSAFHDVNQKVAQSREAV